SSSTYASTSSEVSPDGLQRGLTFRRCHWRGCSHRHTGPTTTNRGLRPCSGSGSPAGHGACFSAACDHAVVVKQRAVRRPAAKQRAAKRRPTKHRAAKPSGFVALPPEHVAASRLAHRITNAIIAREQGWSLDGLSMSRRWRFRVGRSRWIANAFVSCHFSSFTRIRGGRVVYAIHFKGDGPTTELQASALARSLAAP